MKKGYIATAALGLLVGGMLGIGSIPMPTPEEVFVFDAVHEEQLAKFLDEKFGPLPPSAIPDEWRRPPTLGVLRETLNPRGNVDNLSLER